MDSASSKVQSRLQYRYLCFPKVHVIPCHFTRDLHYYGKSIFGKVKMLFMFLSFNKNRYSCGSFANRKQHDVNFQRAEHTLSFMPFWLMKCFIGTLQFGVVRTTQIYLSCVSLGNLCLFKNCIISPNYQICEPGVFLCLLLMRPVFPLLLGPLPHLVYTMFINYIDVFKEPSFGFSDFFHFPFFKNFIGFYSFILLLALGAILFSIVF